MDKLFDNKRKYTGFDGEEYVNMSIPVVKISKFHGNSIVKLNKDDNGRIDNVTWKNVARNLNAIDLVMYANHIFNPFAVQEGDMIYIPDDNDNVYAPSEEPSLPNGTKHSKNSKGEKEMTYAEKVEYLARKGLGLK